jgi:hypothetical protein
MGLQGSGCARGGDEVGHEHELLTADAAGAGCAYERLGATASSTWGAVYCYNTELALPEFPAFVASRGTYDEG